MSAFTVDIYSIYTINIPISLIITEVEELLLASAGTLLGCQPRPGSSILASCSGLTLREFVLVVDGLFTFCVLDRHYCSSAGRGSMQTHSARQSLLLKWLPLKERNEEAL